jgi:mono/diheme cytochrome c family protein/cytochrome c-type biogenesis protein CcmH/NrfF
MATILQKTHLNMSKIKFLSKTSRTLLTLFLTTVLSVQIVIAQDSTKAAAPAGGGDAALISSGEQLFKENCKSCHAVHEESVGPALSGVTKRRKKAWLHSWIRNSSKMIADGDKDAVALFDKYNKTQMTSFPQFSDGDIDALLAYVESVPKAEAPKEGGDAKDKGATTEEKGSKYETLILGLLVLVLFLVLITLGVFLSVIKRYLKDKESTLSESDQELVNQKFDLNKLVRSKGFITIVVLLFIGIAVRSCWMGMMTIGVEQNYAPKQPIPFSHKLHAGQYKINCNYCHTGVYKSKQATIPSLNICMNCHSSIKEGPSGKEAIGKLVAAYEAGTPIKWVRVHNLPDLAYFNHSQHTNVAGLECQKCHGPIEEMEVVRQHSSLTMGWCVNCHRETAVNSKDNAYYDRLLKVHAASKKKGEMTAENIGGLDCSKCHY